MELGGMMHNYPARDPSPRSITQHHLHAMIEREAGSAISNRGQ